MRVSDIARLLTQAHEHEIPALLERFEADERRGVQDALRRTRRRYERITAEKQRVDSLYQQMRSLGGTGVVLGLDEVGRGAVAGPLCVCAVALPDEPHIMGINDSKQLTPQKREILAEEISKVATAVGLAFIEPAAIDALGMARCLRLAMTQAIQEAGVEPQAVLIDGIPLGIHPREKAVVKGDSSVACIAAASIVAKVARDNLMTALDASYPGYHFAQSKGYASAEHIAAIQTLGLSDVHRVSFCSNFVKRADEA
ncbi:MAG: ribonuclease HII [Atopobiaceae bacterium]|nr:ribonuclease HII [Atopobiaceae bacterium]